MSLTTRHDEVRSRTDGRLEPARVLSCCGQDLFMVYQIEGDPHLHLQCASCTESYCPSGDCRATEHVG